MPTFTRRLLLSAGLALALTGAAAAQTASITVASTPAARSIASTLREVPQAGLWYMVAFMSRLTIPCRGSCPP